MAASSEGMLLPSLVNEEDVHRRSARSPDEALSHPHGALAGSPLCPPPPPRSSPTPYPASKVDIRCFHFDDYVTFLASTTGKPGVLNSCAIKRFNIGEDCPMFDSFFISLLPVLYWGSIDAAINLNHVDANITVNWAASLHRAKKSEASRFCYVNNIVLAVLELLMFHRARMLIYLLLLTFNIWTLVFIFGGASLLY
ncbi:Histone deacetylase 19 [Zea mays]|uniref:Histone deacetylase 19 n=1 Tax=Zea mays TaxID=4577 RepID=A0A1D6IY46_MAIZE|nr:Histone deacetylase 19 [Zea mays]